MLATYNVVINVLPNLYTQSQNHSVHGIMVLVAHSDCFNIINECSTRVYWHRSSSYIGHSRELVRPMPY